MKIKIKIIIAVFLIILTAFGQTKDPDVILKKVINSFNKVQDYEVDAKIKIDVDFLKAPDTEAKIYFKQPDKVKFESNTFALLPREGFDFSPNRLLQKKYTAFYVREDTIDEVITSVIKVIPLGETDDVILSTLWIDQAKSVIRKVETTTKTNGTFSIELKYEQSATRYPLPSSMIFSFNIDKTNIPVGFSGDLSPDKDEKKRDTKPTTTGKVYVTYSNYNVNKGIPDKFFEEKEKK